MARGLSRSGASRVSCFLLGDDLNGYAGGEVYGQ